MANVFGIDVSRWQGNFNFEKAKAEGVKYVIIKAGGSDAGRYKDSKFETYYAQCKQLGLPVGAYYFGKDMNTSEAAASANHFLNLIKDKTFEYPIYYDVEGAMINNLNKNTLTPIVDIFCSIIEKAGYYAGIYSSQSFFNNNMNDAQLKKYTHWVAAWSGSKPTLRSGAAVDLWQFGGETNRIRSNKVAGVTCDQDYCYVDFPAVMKKAGLNGYKKESAPEAEHLYHIVNETDTLTGIAERYGVPVDELAAKNNLIRKGDKLTIK